MHSQHTISHTEEKQYDGNVWKHAALQCNVGGSRCQCAVCAMRIAKWAMGIVKCAIGNGNGQWQWAMAMGSGQWAMAMGNGVQ